MEVSKKDFEKILRTQIYKASLNMFMFIGLLSILIDLLKIACESIGISQHWKLLIIIPIWIYIVYFVNKEIKDDTRKNDTTI